jgi:F-type H+-transporting ATPase subunit gamma
LPGIRNYAESVASGIAATLLLAAEAESLPRGVPGRLAHVICMAEHGFVGGFNERLFEAVASMIGAKDLLFVLGSRGGTTILERGRQPDWMHPMATRSSAAPDMVYRLSAELYRRIAAGEITKVEVVYARYHRAGGPTIERRMLLPLDRAALRVKPPRQPPLHNLAPEILREKLIAEYLFALLTEAAVESIASENTARLAAMESAHDNISRKLKDLRRAARQARQSEITTELLDLMTGAEAQSREAAR